MKQALVCKIQNSVISKPCNLRFFVLVDDYDIMPLLKQDSEKLTFNGKNWSIIVILKEPLDNH